MHDLYLDLKNFCLKYKLHYIFMFIILALFAYFTLTSRFMYEFNKDEIHSWNIATYLNFGQIIELMRAEGHTFVWYMMLKPFTHNPDIFFPWIIKCLNWLCVFCAVIVFWFKSPINIFFKTLITFSYPLVGFSTLGKCYGVGILLYFLVASLYKDRFKHPFIFALLLFFTANTSFISALGVGAISVVFLYDMLKDKARNDRYYCPILMTLAIPLSLYVQWHHHLTPCYATPYINLLYFNFLYHVFQNYDFVPTPALPAVILSFGTIISAIFFWKNKRVLIYLFSTFIFFILFSVLIYPSFNYHYLYMYLVFVVCLWMYESEPYKTVNKRIIKCFYIWLLIMSIIMLTGIKRKCHWYMREEKYIEHIGCIYKTIPLGSTIYTNMYMAGQVVPELKDDYVLKIFTGEDLLTFNGFFYTYNKMGHYAAFDLKYLKSIDKNVKNKYVMYNPGLILQYSVANRVIDNSVVCEPLRIYKIETE